jgi:hypothetical protein
VKGSKTLGRIGTALSLARIVAINVFALAVAAAAAVHVHNRASRRKAAPIVAAPAASSAAPSFEIELEGPAPVGSGRAPALPGVNDASRP